MPALCLGLRVQDLRHTHKTMLIELRIPEVLQNERLGHHPVGVAGLYTHSTPAMHTQLTAALQRLLNRDRWHLYTFIADRAIRSLKATSRTSPSWTRCASGSRTSASW